jgi:hypothetical protein
MALRFLHASPQQLLNMDTDTLLTSIRISEGRILTVSGRTRSGNLVDYVTNAEVAAAFGADIVMLDTYEPENPYIPGWTSKNPKDDEATADIQVPMGRGWSLKEIRQIVGRPIACMLLFHGDMNKSATLKHYGRILATAENAQKAIESGTDMIAIGGWAPLEVVQKSIREIRQITKGKAILEYFRPHGPGLIGQIDNNLGPEKLLTKEEIQLYLDADVDIVGLAAPGTYPGYTVDFVAELVEMIHNAGKMASLGLHTSQEGSDIDTIKRIAILAKMAGADLYELGDSGFNEQMIEPRNIMALSIAIRGHRHTYRRMAMSIKR